MMLLALLFAVSQVYVAADQPRLSPSVRQLPLKDCGDMVVCKELVTATGQCLTWGVVRVQCAPKNLPTTGQPMLPLGAPVMPVGAPVMPVGAPVMPVGTPLVPVGAPVLPVGAPLVPVGAPMVPLGAPLVPVAPPVGNPGRWMPGGIIARNNLVFGGRAIQPYLIFPKLVAPAFFGRQNMSNANKLAAGLARLEIPAMTKVPDQVNSEFEFTWVVPNFRSSEVQQQHRIQSPEFSASEDDPYQWFLNLHPRGEDQNSEETFLWLNLKAAPHEDHVKVSVKVQVSIINVDNLNVIRTNTFKTFWATWGGQKVFQIKTDYLLDESLGLLHGDDLIINIRMQTV